MTQSTCIEWDGLLDRDGYGRVYIGNRRMGRAHRVTWERAHGPIPKGMCVCHHCDNPRCVNIDHLFLGTNQENTADREAKGRGPQGERNPRARLTHSQVEEIRIGTTSTRAAAREFGISKSLVSLIRRGERWP